jgi:hypothetical protein
LIDLALSLCDRAFSRLSTGDDEELSVGRRFFTADTADGVVIDETHGLHEGKDRRWSDKFPAALLEVF